MAVNAYLLLSGGPVNAQSNTGSNHPFDRVNQKAKESQTGNINTAKGLVDEIIEVSGFESELRGFAASAVTERVGRAESRFRQGLTSGIPESKIVRTVNGLAIKFNLPRYAKTSTSRFASSDCV